MDRRKLIIGGAALIAAPAIVRAEWIMPVKVIEPIRGGGFNIQKFYERARLRDGGWQSNPTLVHAYLTNDTRLYVDDNGVWRWHRVDGDGQRYEQDRLYAQRT